VRALLETPEAAFEGLGNPVFNVAGDDTRPLKEFVEEIHRLCKGGGSCLYGDRKENAEGAVNLIPDIGKICRITGWKPETAFGEGIKKTLESR
jgi:nucleoside-diphosphate-sugar epimerases